MHLAEGRLGPAQHSTAAAKAKVVEDPQRSVSGSGRPLSSEAAFWNRRRMTDERLHRWPAVTLDVKFVYPAGGSCWPGRLTAVMQRVRAERGPPSVPALVKVKSGRAAEPEEAAATLSIQIRLRSEET